MFNPFVGTRATAEARLFHNSHQNFVGCDIDSDCIHQMKPSHGNVFGTQVFISKSDIEEYDIVRRTAKECLL